jgi:hypothetical protein
LSHDDFEEALQYIAKLAGAQDDVLRRALLSAAIVAYARPFSNNSGGATGSATSQLAVRLNKVLTAEEQRLHETLISLRNEVVAHTDFDRKPVKRLKGTHAGFTMSGKLFDLLAQPIDLSLFQAMCNGLRAHCFHSMMELNKQIVEAENAP